MGFDRFVVCWDRNAEMQTSDEFGWLAALWRKTRLIFTFGEISFLLLKCTRLQFSNHMPSFRETITPKLQKYIILLQNPPHKNMRCPHFLFLSAEPSTHPTTKDLYSSVEWRTRGAVPNIVHLATIPHMRHASFRGDDLAFLCIGNFMWPPAFVHDCLFICLFKTDNLF